MKTLAQRWVFVLMTSTVLVVFSEKIFWYVQGFALLEVVLFYALPTYVFLWAVDHFRVRRLAALFVAGGLYGFVVEGVLVATLYEDGLLGVFGVAYAPLGWHALVSVLFGWYVLRRWLVQRRARRLALGSALFGLYWGVWSLIYWLPQSLEDETWLADGWDVGQWPVEKFAAYAFLVTGALALAHWLLGRGVWRTHFESGRIERVLVAIVLVGGFFLAGVVPVVPLALIKLPLLLGFVFLALRANRRIEGDADGSLLQVLAGPVRWRDTLLLFAMPLTATAVYGVAYALDPHEALIELAAGTAYILSSIVGGGGFVVSVWRLWRAGRRAKTRRAEVSDGLWPDVASG